MATTGSTVRHARRQRTTISTLVVLAVGLALLGAPLGGAAAEIGPGLDPAATAGASSSTPGTCEEQYAAALASLEQARAALVAARRERVADRADRRSALRDLDRAQERRDRLRAEGVPDDDRRAEQARRDVTAARRLVRQVDRRLTRSLPDLRAATDARDLARAQLVDALDCVDEPTDEPTDGPTEGPTDGPTDQPTDVPTDVPTEEPTDAPTEQPTAGPDPDPAPRVGSVLLEGDGAFFSAPGQSRRVTVQVLDDRGDPMVVDPSSITWTSSAPDVVAVTDGLLVAVATNGSTSITATVGRVVSAPVVAVVTPVPATTVLLDDEQIDVPTAELVTVADPESDEDGLPDLSIVVRLEAPPTIGQVLLAAGDIPMSGRVVSSEALGEDRYRVVLAPVGIEEALPDLTVDQRIDLSDELGPTPPLEPGITDLEIDPADTEPPAARSAARRTAARQSTTATPSPFAGDARTVLERGPLKCELEGSGINAPPFRLTMDKPLDLAITPVLDVDVRDGQLHRLAVDVRGTVKVQASVRLELQADIKLQCKARTGKTIVGFLKKVPGLRSLVSGDIDFGKGFSVELRAVGPGVQATAGASLSFTGSWGFERNAATGELDLIDDNVVSDFVPTTKLVPTGSAATTDIFDFRTDGALEVFVYADFKAAPGSLSGPIGDRVFDNSAGEEKTTIAGGKLGVRLQASTDDLDDQLRNPNHATTYEWLAGGQFKVGVNKTIRTLLRLLGVRELTLLDLRELRPTFVSPRQATLSVTALERDPASLTAPDFAEDRAFPGDTVRLRATIREGLTFLNPVLLPPLPAPTFNIDAVRVVTLGTDGEVVTLAEQEVDFSAPPLDLTDLLSPAFTFDLEVTGYTGDLDDLFLVADTVFPGQLATPLGPVLPGALLSTGWPVELARAQVDGLPPTADFSVDREAESGDGDLTVLLDASTSTDPDDDIVSYLWDFGDGTVEETLTPTTTHTYAQEGTFTITLTVTDSLLATDSTSRTVTLLRPLDEPIGVRFFEADATARSSIACAASQSDFKGREARNERVFDGPEPSTDPAQGLAFDDLGLGPDGGSLFEVAAASSAACATSIALEPVNSFQQVRSGRTAALSNLSVAVDATDGVVTALRATGQAAADGLISSGSETFFRRRDAPPGSLGGLQPLANTSTSVQGSSSTTLSTTVGVVLPFPRLVQVTSSGARWRFNGALLREGTILEAGVPHEFTLVVGADGSRCEERSTETFPDGPISEVAGSTGWRVIESTCPGAATTPISAEITFEEVP